MLTVLVVSDATGETAERVVRSALVQFEAAEVVILRRGGVRTAEQIHAVVDEASGHDSLIVHTLVEDDCRRLMLEECRLRGVDAMNLMGPVLERLATHLRLTPREKPGLFSQLVETKLRRIEAVEFAFRHDDGQRPEELDQAEIVLVGVSRTMKTPTTVYLAYQAWFAANVPFVPGLELPDDLLALPAGRVLGLVMNAVRLAELRQSRARHLGLSDETYDSLPAIREELRQSQAVFAARGWPVVDVTGKSVEEVAHEVLALHGDAGRRRGSVT